MKIIAAEDRSSSGNKKLKAKVSKLIFDDIFLEKVKMQLETYNPICHLINECQKPSTSIADAVNLWLNLKIPEKFYSFYENRLSMALNPYALTAFYLHPYYDNDKIPTKYLVDIINLLLKSLNAAGLTIGINLKEY